MKILFYMWLCLLTWPFYGQEVPITEEEVQTEEEILPSWENEELLNAVNRGEVIPGSSLMGRVARERLFSGAEEPLELDQAVEEEKVEEVKVEGVVEDWPTTIAENFHSAYFREPPSGYLVDPQNLLTPQEKRDRDGFFTYHAQGSSIDIYFYLFDSKQELPEGESPQQVMSEHLLKDGPSVVVFYYLGMPERTQIAYSPLVERFARPIDKKEALLRSVEEALECSDDLAQIESFSVQLSIRLYRIEKELGDFTQKQSGLMHPLSEVEVVVSKEEYLLVRLWNSDRARSVMGGFLILLFAAGAGFVAKWFAERKRIYVFPESEGSLLLDAPHAAGVGALIAYDSPASPPSLQRDEVPDYLQRM